MKNELTIPGIRHKMQRAFTWLLWGLFFLIKGLVGTAILILAVAATAVGYLLALPWVVYIRIKQH